MNVAEARSYCHGGPAVTAICISGKGRHDARARRATFDRKKEYSTSSCVSKVGRKQQTSLSTHMSTVLSPQLEKPDLAPVFVMEATDMTQS